MTSQQEDDDPYVQRSFSEYYSDGQASSPPSRPSSSASTASTRTSATSAGHTYSQGQARQTYTTLRPVRWDITGSAEGSDEVEIEVRAEHENGENQAAGEEEPLLGEGSSGPTRGFGPGASNGEGQEGEEDDDSDTDSYYALLNVQKEASEDEIRDAYRSLAVALHPDKHISPDLKASAENRFRAVQRAYEVLSDPEKRSIYDHFGVRGLGRNWSLVRHSSTGGPRTAAEMREEWERLARQRKAEEMENMVRSKSEFVASLDASSLFCSADNVPRSKELVNHIGREIARIEAETGQPIQEGQTLEIEVPDVTFAERWAPVGFTSLMGKQGWETPLTMYTRLLVNGQMVSRGRMGGGNVVGTLRTQWNSKFSTEISSALLRPRVVSLKGQYELTKFSFVNFVASGSTFVVPPRLQVSFGQRLSEKSPLTGFTVFNTGSYTVGLWGAGMKVREETPNIVIGMSSGTGIGKGWTCQTGVGLENQSLTVDYSYRPAILGSPKMRLGFTLGTRSGLSAFHSMERKITDNVKFGLGVYFGIPLGGVTLQVRFNRLDQKVVMPIQLSPHYRPDLVAGCIVLPGLGLLAAEHLYFRPMRRRNVRNRLVKLRTQHADLILQRKQAAREAIDVLRQNARKRAHAEYHAGGFVVVQAYYGKRDSWPALRDDISPDDLFRATWGGFLQEQSNGGSHEQSAETQQADSDKQDWWDVTVPVMMLVHRGQLVIPGERQKHKLMGFFDPCMGERKHLVVRYLFRGRLHHVVVDDITQLTAPLRVHQL